MIAHQDLPADPIIDACRLAVLETLECVHPIFCFSTVDALEHVLDEILKELDELRKVDPDVPGGLTDMILLFKDNRAVNAVARRMQPGFDFLALALPDGWPILYQRLPDLRRQAARYDPSFVPKYR